MAQPQLNKLLLSSLAAIVAGIGGIFSQNAAALQVSLDNVDSRRLDYALSAIKELQKDWPILISQESCILLFGEQAEWLINCRNPGRKWEALTGKTFNDMPVYYSSNPVSLPHQQMPYTQVKQALVAQAFVYLPSDPSTQAYKDRPWFTISRLKELTTNHPGFGGDTTTEEWLSIFIHEYFHIAQLTEPHTVEFMIAKSSQAAFVPQAELAQFYTENPDYSLAIKEEYDLLSNALSMKPHLERTRAKQVLLQWVKLYQRRIKTFSKSFEKGDSRRDLALWDAYWTYIEGVARYVESKFLIDARYHSKAGIPDDPHFSGFNFLEGKGYSGLPAPNKKISKKYYYSIGLHLSFLLDAIEPGWEAKIFSNKLWLVGTVLEKSTVTP